jgi:hypothetical protein
MSKDKHVLQPLRMFFLPISSLFPSFDLSTVLLAHYDDACMHIYAANNGLRRDIRVRTSLLADKASKF